MTELWFAQRRTKDAVVALLKSFVHYVEQPISKRTIEQKVEGHPEYPFLSLSAISDLLKEWGMVNVIYSVPGEALSELPVPSIAFINEQYRGGTMGNFVLFFGVADQIVRYLHPRRGWVYEPLPTYIQQRSETMLSLVEISTPGEPDFQQKEQAYADQLEQDPNRAILKEVEDFITSEDCTYIINLAQDKFDRSRIDDPNAPVGEGRTSYTAELVLPDDLVLSRIRNKASTLLGLPESHFEDFQCVSYTAGQEYQNHYDTFDSLSEMGKEALKNGGQRVYTILVYLNEDFSGGQTHFPMLDLLIDPKEGKAVVFRNTDKQGEVLKHSWHSGLPVSYGRKYALNIWVRERPLLKS